MQPISKHHSILKAFLSELPSANLPCNFRMQVALSDSFTGNNLFAFLLLVAIVGALTLALAALSSKCLQVTQAKNSAKRLLNPIPVTTAALILGMGMGGLFDGIVFHQILQWHSMLSNSIPPLTSNAVHINMFWDGLFHFVMLLVVGTGVVAMLRLVSRPDIDFSPRLFSGGMLAGWGIFNLIEGTINHHMFKLHNVRENTEEAGLYNIIFMASSLAIFLIGGYFLKTTLAKAVVS